MLLVLIRNASVVSTHNIFVHAEENIDQTSDEVDVAPAQHPLSIHLRSENVKVHKVEKSDKN